MSTPEKDLAASTPDAHPPDPKVIETVEQRQKRYRAKIKERAERSGQDATLIDWMRSKLTEVKGRDARSHQAHLTNMGKTAKYLEGEQYGTWDENGNYTPYAPLPNEVAYCLPVIIGHFQQALMMYLKTDLAYQGTAKDQTNPADVQLVKMAKALGTEDFTRLMDEMARVDEGINSLTAGENHRCLLWGVHDNPKTIDKPIYDEAGFVIPARKICNSCNMDNAPDAAECAECGSDWLRSQESVTQRKQVFKGTKKVPVGQNMLHIPHMAAVKSDSSARTIQDATYVVETDYLANKDVAQWLYQCVIEDGDRTSDAVRLQRAQQGGVTNIGRQGLWRDRGDDQQGASYQLGGPVERNSVWLEVSEYGYKSFPQDETLPDGTVLPANTLMGEKWNSGFKYCLVGNTCVNGGAGNKKRQWHKLLYSNRPGTSRGMGIQIFVPLQDLTNEGLNLDLDIIMTSVPFRAVVGSYIDRLPRANEFLKLNKLPPGGSIDSIFKQYASQTPSGAVGAMSEQLQEAGQFILGTFSAVGRTSDPSQKALGTAHGVAAVVEQQNGRFVTPTTQRVACDKELLFAICANIQDNASDEQKEELKRRFGPDTVDDFFKANLEHVMTWEVVSGSDRPRSDALTGAVMTEFGNLAATMTEKMPSVPWVGEFLSTLGDLVGIPFKMVPGGSDRHEAETRLRKLAAIERDIQKRKPELLQNPQDAAEKMFGLLEEFIGPLSLESAMAEARKHGDESGINGAVPFLYMQNHQAMGEVYKEEYFSDDAQMFSQARKAVIAHMFALTIEAFAAAEGLKAEFQSGLMQKLAPPDPKATNKPTQGLAKIIESISFKDAKEFPTVAKQIVEGAGMDASGMYPDESPAPDGAGGDGVQPEEHLQSIDEEVVKHHLKEQGADAQLQRDLIKQGHKAETELAVHEGKTAAEARYSAFKPEGTGGKKE